MTDPTAQRSRNSYRIGTAIAVLTILLTIWTTIVRDDSSGGGFFMIIMAAGVGAFAARFQAAGVARAMLGVAAMQIAWGLLLATAPVIANTPDGSARALIFNAVFAGLWLAAAACFRAAARNSLSYSAPI